MGFDFHVHGLWILGAAFFFVAGIMAGNLQWTLGTTEVSYAISVVLIFILFLVAAMFWISAAVNARQDEFGSRSVKSNNNIAIYVHRDGRVEKKHVE
jgi:hypothetical protein